MDINEVAGVKGALNFQVTRKS